MQDTPEKKSYTRNVNSTRRCHECSEEALGRCPDCHQVLCQEHFPKNQHSPCAEKQMKIAQTQVCYVCGTQAYPDQWSISKTSHYVDQAKCKGCGRYVCDDLHTQRKVEDVVIEREGLRGHRYQYIHRYCDLCSPLYRVGGIKGLTRIIVGIGTVAAGAFFYFHH
ncbi:hypothetical protein [Tengunoibacter tsumagoiensis]|uniref:Uncharacterized protein n=1 Tax=Tengunoibacter tsumagoiensis TaxID=2014871 RepID=A0A401ZY37_9CHLR|nr:hypothetical protein [Tengunoibacter tsumagoiensis]GCE11774.1 hypothetical protein KTT_16330 [Tengunoibacter tsumagoiensis]